MNFLKDFCLWFHEELLPSLHKFIRNLFHEYSQKLHVHLVLNQIIVCMGIIYLKNECRVSLG